MPSKHMKGVYKRRLTGFRSHPENICNGLAREADEGTPRAVHRLSQSDFDAIVEDDVTLRDADGKQCLDVMLLRPEVTEVNDTCYTDDMDQGTGGPGSKISTYIFVHSDKNAKQFNDAFWAHVEASPQCRGYLVYNSDNVERWGLCWSLALKCTDCQFQTEKTHLYEEVQQGKRGRKAAKPNVSVQVGLARQGISAEGFSDILTSADIIPPSIRGMRKAANQVCDKLIDANNQDMAEHMNDLKRQNANKGLREDAPINIEVDCRYNNPLSSGAGRTPMQPATQATFLVAENMTKGKKIIACKSLNKLCTCGYSGEGEEGHASHCRANLEMSEPISQEGKLLDDAVETINQQGLVVRHVTMDGDSSANYSAQQIKQGEEECTVKVLRCTRHLTRAMEREVKRTTFSRNMFGETTTRQGDRERLQARFALDIGDRCNAEYTACYRRHRDDPEKCKNRLSYIPDAVIECYKGNCELCKKYSFVCNGNSKRWRRNYMARACKSNKAINPGVSDIEKLRKCMAIRLGKKALSMTFLNTNTNKVEGANRGLSKSVPKHMTFPRNYGGRAAAAVHSMNNGPGRSLVKLAKKVDAPLTSSPAMETVLKRKDKKVTCDKKRQQSQQYKTSRAAHRNQRYWSYDERAATKNYCKGQADAKLIREVRKGKADHSYSKLTV